MNGRINVKGGEGVNLLEFLECLNKEAKVIVICDGKTIISGEAGLIDKKASEYWIIAESVTHIDDAFQILVYKDKVKK